MNKKNLFHVAVLFHEFEKGTVIIVQPKWILATNSVQARVILDRMVPDAFMDNLNSLEFFVVPFA